MASESQTNSPPETLLAPELPAPAGMKYADSISAYQIAIGFRANAEALQRRLPKGQRVTDDWGAIAILNGTNLLMSFHDTYLESIPTNGGKTHPHSRFLIFGARARNDSTNETHLWSIFGFGSDPAAVPGKYADKKLAKSVHRSLNLIGDATKTSIKEGFDIDAGEDGTVHFAVEYERPLPMWIHTPPGSPRSNRFRAAKAPDLPMRVYSEDVVNYTLISRALNMNVTSKLEVQVSVPDLSDVFDGAETTSLVIRPYYSRRVFNPTT